MHPYDSLLDLELAQARARRRSSIFYFLLHKPGPDLQARYYINGLPGLEKFEPVPPLVVVIQKRFDCN